jgi:hypothetical protein
MANHTGHKTKAQVKAEVALLKKAGLYSGDLRKPITDYAQRLTRRYADVIAGEAQVVKISPTKSSAKKIAEHLSNEYAGLVRKASGGKVIVKNLNKKYDEKLSYSHSEQTIVSTTKSGDERVRHVYLRNAGIRFNPKTMSYEAFNVPELKNNQRYAVPYLRNGKLGYSYFANMDDLIDEKVRYEKYAVKSGYKEFNKIQIVSRRDAMKHRPKKLPKNVVALKDIKK